MTSPQITPPLFLLSFRHRDALAGMAGRAGWHPVAARRAEGADQRFLESGAQVAVVDARDALFDGLEAIRQLSDPVGAMGGALVVLLGRKDRNALEAVYQAGATHYLVEPFIENDLHHALRFAERHARRLSGRWQRVTPVAQDGAAGATGGTDDDAMPGARDWLTSLPDAGAIHQWLGRALAQDPPPVLMLVAISHFETINAAYGRRAGDMLLQMLARRLDRLVGQTSRRSTLIGRLSGAEFAVALHDPQGPDMARMLAGQIMAETDRPFVIESDLITLSCRVAIAVADPGDDSLSLLRRAGLALARASLGETGPVQIAESADGDRPAIDTLDTDLRRAIDGNEIELLFQPQCNTGNRKINGVEALARWQHPKLGQINAATLFDVAARSDCLLELSAHIHRKALGMAAAWPAVLGELRLSINVTAADIARPDFADNMLAMVAESGFDADRLTLEITESGLIDNLADAASLLATLRANGIRIAIDDFGTGYSSLAYLKSLPLDYLKIDQHFARDIIGTTRDKIVVRSVIEMALSLGLTVIAEGIETDEQLALIAAEGCAIVQGFLFAEPLDSAQLVAFAG